MTYPIANRNWTIQEGPDSLEPYKQVCQSNTIPEVKKWVRKKRNGDVDFELLLKAEKKTKDRKGIKKWVNAIIDGQIDYQFDLLSWIDRLGILKSGLQKYIRRSETEKALRTAKRLFLMSDRSAVRRMKVIITEDVLPATPVVQYLSQSTSLRGFMGAVKVTAESQKSARAVDYISHLDELEGKEGREREEKLQQIIQQESGLRERIARVYEAVEFGESKEQIFEVLERNYVTESFAERLLKGTYFSDDSQHMIAGAVLYNAKPELFIDLDEKPTVNPNDYTIMKFRELEYFILDQHTVLGRVALRIWNSQHEDIDREEMENAWYQCIGNFYEDPVRDDANEVDEELRFLWNTYGHEIKELVEYARTEIYNLASYDEF